MVLIASTIGLVLILCVLAVVTARVFRDYPNSELLDWRPTRSIELEVENEQDDVRQMLAAQNEYRRKRGARELTEADIERQAAADEAVRARGSGPFAQQREQVDELDGVDSAEVERLMASDRPKRSTKSGGKRKGAARSKGKGPGSGKKRSER